jgi:hypothetical protein
MKLRLTLALLALAVAGCATPTFSYIDGQKYFQTNLNTYSVIVLSVDGTSYLTNPVMVTKFGPTQVQVQGPPPPGWQYGDTRTITIDVQPCRHYYLKAVKPNPLALDFTAEVDFIEPITGCKP